MKAKPVAVALLASAMMCFASQGCGSASSNPHCTSDCDGGSPDGGQGPEAFVYARVTAPTGASCPGSAMSAPLYEVGESTVGTPTPSPSVSISNVGSLTVNCAVHAVGNGFSVNLVATQVGAGGGSMTITSPASQGAVTTSGGSPLSASITSTVNHAMYSSQNCSLTYAYNGSPITALPAVSPGRIWGHLSCPAATGGTGSCDVEADFLFEKCTQ
jgi:hypothetical protein